MRVEEAWGEHCQSASFLEDATLLLVNYYLQNVRMLYDELIYLVTDFNKIYFTIAIPFKYQLSLYLNLVIVILNSSNACYSLVFLKG